LPFNDPVTDIIRQRYSCRIYDKTPIAPEQARQLAAFTRSLITGPLGTPLRFELVVAEEQDRTALQGLGTYGLIKHPAGFIIGALGSGKMNLEDFGSGMETILLYATSLGLGTCWLGGNFTRSSFSSKIQAAREEIVPAVAAVGNAAEENRARDWLARKVKSDTRLPWKALFFQSGFANPLTPERAGAYALPLEMLRLAPSGHNYQPWRVVRDGDRFHFYLQRTQGYGTGSPIFILLGIADLPRIEIGIAMCHFELTARELGLEGQWEVQEPALQKPGGPLEYIVTWAGKLKDR
jgi:nitroreductase